MAVLDPRDNSVVIRVVYDGTPMAGKTTSVGALGRAFGGSVHSPAELEGRTLYFDWLEYTGGWFEGHPVRCQIVSVPGQTSLAPRRRRLLESADVVVFVGNSSAEGLAEDAAYLRQVQGLLTSRNAAPVGIVLQANKRDLDKAVPLEELRSLLEQLGLRIAVVESVATQGTGIREAFVLAVRLALDRVRELMNQGTLCTTPPTIDTAEDLLRELQQGEAGAPLVAVWPQFTAPSHSSLPQETLASVALREVVDTASPEHAVRLAAAATSHRPVPPDARVASGLIWPPVDGRVILHELTTSPPQLSRLEGSAWSGVAGRWRCYTSTEFTTLDEGRAALVEWARTHSQCQGLLSRDRCLVLVADADNCFRLWQVVKSQRTLREQFEAALQESADALAAALLLVIRSFLRMAAQLSAAPYALPLSVDNITITDSGACYTGIAPGPHEMPAARAWNQSEAGDLLMNQLHMHRAALHARRIEVLAALAQQVKAAGVLNRSEWLLLQRLVLLKGDGLPSDPQRRSA